MRIVIIRQKSRTAYAEVGSKQAIRPFVGLQSKYQQMQTQASRGPAVRVMAGKSGEQMNEQLNGSHQKYHIYVLFTSGYDPKCLM